MTEVAFTYDQLEWKNVLPWPVSYKTVINVRDQERFEKDLNRVMQEMEKTFKEHPVQKKHQRKLEESGHPNRTAYMIQKVLEMSKGNIISIARYRNKKEHDGLNGEPQYISFYENGQTEKIIHKKNGKLDNAGKIPAVQEFHRNGEVSLIEKHLNGQPYAAMNAQVGEIMMCKLDAAGNLLDGRITARGEAREADETGTIHYDTQLVDLSPELYASIRANELVAAQNASAPAAQEGTVLQRAFGKDAKALIPKAAR